jgi:hypothetical protein
MDYRLCHSRLAREVRSLAQRLYDPSGGARPAVRVLPVFGPTGVMFYSASVGIDRRFGPIARVRGSHDEALRALLRAVRNVAAFCEARD